ncbi:MAG: LamG domain-containing protein [Flavobacteriales bacterium]
MKKTLLFLAVFTLGTTAFAQIPNYVPSNGLVGWWPFNGNANDESGNGNNGTVNGATLTIDRFGNANQAYGFDGVDDFIEVINSTQVTLIGNLTMSAWVNTFGSNGQNYQTIISKRATYWTSEYAMALSYHTGVIHDTKLMTSRMLGQGNQEQAWTNNPFSIMNWEFWTIVYSTGQVSLYKNGIVDHSQPFTLVPTQQICPLLFGKNTLVDNTEQFFGKIDDIGIWNRALTECEIQDLYHAQLNSASLSISAGSDQSICSGDNVILNGAGGANYQWNNNVVDGQAFAPAQSNAYVVTAQDTLGCTGTDTVVVTVLENATSTLTETALDSYTLNGQTYTQSGTYTQTLTAANGCDSTITLNLTLNFTGMDELGAGVKKLVKITDLNGKIIPRRKNTLMLFIYEDGSVEWVVEMEE